MHQALADLFVGLFQMCFGRRLLLRGYSWAVFHPIGEIPAEMPIEPTFESTNAVSQATQVGGHRAAATALQVKRFGGRLHKLPLIMTNWPSGSSMEST